MISRREMWECADREVRQRRRVYPRLVASGKMSQEFADRQIAVMEAIRDHFGEAPAQGDMLAGLGAK